MKHVKLFEDFVNEADMTKDYDGFIVLDMKSKKQYKFKYVKGTNNVKIENDAIAKLVSSTKEPRGNFSVYGFVRKGEWDKSEAEEINEAFANEAIDIKYWADYNTDTSGQSDPGYANKSKDFEGTFKQAVKDWNDMGEDPITNQEAEKAKKIAKEFFNKAGWISVNVAQAIIAQES